MKRPRLRTAIIIVAAILCATMIHASAASTQLLPWIDDNIPWLNPHETTAQAPEDNTTVPAPPETTTVDNNQGQPSTVTGTGTVPYQPPTAAPYNGNDVYTYTRNPNTLPSLTTAPSTAVTEATSFRSSLSDLIERDSAAVVVSPVTAGGYTLRPGSVVQENPSGGVTWQMAALIAAAVLFVILAALLIALYVQKRKVERDGYGVPGGGPREYRPVRPVRSADGSLIPDRDGDETMEPQRSAAPTYHGDPGDIDPIGTAEAIRAAAIADTLTGLDPLIRKYSDTRADRFEDEENMTNEEILRATDDIIADIERQDRDREDIEARAEDMLGEEEVACPACGAMNPKRCMFCRECGQYLR